ncbi:hypothetical protein HIM_07597 [Hirsutella minnesotensis 3608]|uniref:Uncharacterized protein n=1 Tax=Hirsutella minnesotensis 3608 TaxID=1043627 RepID=A0A0F7ZN28_9HYPO|nr:hypothetical protein HIM_07597 [Hirsutella minnesotensis 3608]
MAAAQSTSSLPDEPPYPSFRELRSNGESICFSKAFKRLCWPLEGAFPSAMSVMRIARNSAEVDPFFQPDTSGSGSGTWHEISSLPITNRKVSSIQASIRDIDQWEFDWVEAHQEHATAEYVTYGDLSDEDRPFASEPDEDGNWEADSDTEFLIRCCGEDRPLRKTGFTLEVTPSTGNDFISIRDYLSGKSSP